MPSNMPSTMPSNIHVSALSSIQMLLKLWSSLERIGSHPFRRFITYQTMDVKYAKFSYGIWVFFFEEAFRKYFSNHVSWIYCWSYCPWNRVCMFIRATDDDLYFSIANWGRGLLHLIHNQIMPVMITALLIAFSYGLRLTSPIGIWPSY